MPGLFMPGQVASIEEHFGCRVEDLLGSALAISRWKWRNGAVTFMLSPQERCHVGRKLLPMSWGRWWDTGCVLLRDDRCSIHEIKPYECAALDCTADSDARIERRHRYVAEQWRRATALQERFGRVKDGGKVRTIDVADVHLGSGLAVWI